MENNIGKTIEINRKKNGWSRKQLADKLGVNVSMISFYERGVKIPSDKKKLVLCNLFNLTWNELIGTTPDEVLENDISKLLFDMKLNKDELKFVLDKLLEFYCNNGDYSDFEHFIVSNSYIDKEKVETCLSKIEILLFDFFKNEIYQKKGKKNAILMSEISKFIQKNFSETMKRILQELNIEDILHENFITIYKETPSGKFFPELYAHLTVKGYLYYPKEYKKNKTKLFALLIENQSYTTRFQPDDVVTFKEQKSFIFGKDVLVSINGELQIVTLFKHKENHIIIQRSNEYFDIYSAKEQKDINLKILGIPIDIQINYFNRNYDIS